VEGAQVAAYLNPDLENARARLRGSDSRVLAANSGYWPSINVTLQAGGLGPYKLHSAAAVTLQQKLFDRTLAPQVEAAEAQVKAGRAELLSTEESVLLAASTAYADVMRSREMVSLYQDKVKVLEELLSLMKARHENSDEALDAVGRLATDLAVSGAELRNAEADLAKDEAAFKKIIGYLPGPLEDPKLPLNLLPKTLEEAKRITRANNPGILAAESHELELRHQLEAARARGGLTVSASGSITTAGESLGSPAVPTRHEGRLLVTAQIPLFDAGKGAAVEEALAAHDGSQAKLRSERESALENVTALWNAVVEGRDKVAALELALKESGDVIQDSKVQRTSGATNMSKIITGYQSNWSAREKYITYRRNVIVASYGLLAVTGRLTAEKLSLPVALYDPAQHYEAVKYHWGASLAKPLGGFAR
jgi:outer membrane protein TolC